MPSSYQRRLQNIKYLEQCVKELEDIVRVCAEDLYKNNIPFRFFGKGISGDNFITPYNNQEFVMQLPMKGDL